MKPALVVLMLCQPLFALENPNSQNAVQRASYRRSILLTDFQTGRQIHPNPSDSVPTQMIGTIDGIERIQAGIKVTAPQTDAKILEAVTARTNEITAFCIREGITLPEATMARYLSPEPFPAGGQFDPNSSYANKASVKNLMATAMDRAQRSVELQEERRDRANEHFALMASALANTRSPGDVGLPVSPEEARRGFSMGANMEFNAGEGAQGQAPAQTAGRAAMAKSDFEAKSQMANYLDRIPAGMFSRTIDPNHPQPLIPMTPQEHRDAAVQYAAMMNGSDGTAWTAIRAKLAWIPAAFHMSAVDLNSPHEPVTAASVLHGIGQFAKDRVDEMVSNLGARQDAQARFDKSFTWENYKAAVYADLALKAPFNPAVDTIKHVVDRSGAFLDETVAAYDKPNGENIAKAGLTGASILFTAWTRGDKVADVAESIMERRLADREKRMVANAAASVTDHARETIVGKIAYAGSNKTIAEYSDRALNRSALEAAKAASDDPPTSNFHFDEIDDNARRTIDRLVAAEPPEMRMERTAIVAASERLRLRPTASATKMIDPFKPGQMDQFEGRLVQVTELDNGTPVTRIGTLKYSGQDRIAIAPVHTDYHNGPALETFLKERLQSVDLLEPGQGMAPQVVEIFNVARPNP